MRYIKIANCHGCPWTSTINCRDYYCFISSRRKITGNLFKGIPEWCPLPDDTQRDLLNLLAVIHRDGGQYTDLHGLQKSVDDAMQIVSELIHKEGEGKNHV